MYRWCDIIAAIARHFHKSYLTQGYWGELCSPGEAGANLAVLYLLVVFGDFSFQKNGVLSVSSPSLHLNRIASEEQTAAVEHRNRHPICYHNLVDRIGKGNWLEIAP